MVYQQLRRQQFLVQYTVWSFTSLGRSVVAFCSSFDAILLNIEVIKGVSTMKTATISGSILSLIVYVMGALSGCFQPKLSYPGIRLEVRTSSRYSCHITNTSLQKIWTNPLHASCALPTHHCRRFEPTLFTPRGAAEVEASNQQQIQNAGPTVTGPKIRFWRTFLVVHNTSIKC